MKNNGPRIGLVGGIGYEATLLYYKEINKRLFDVYEKHGQPEIVIFSLNHKKMIDWLFEGKDEENRRCLVESVQFLENSGCSFAAICCNTAHIFYDQVKNFKMPVISIIEEVFTSIEKRGLKKALILGSKATMTNKTYPTVFERRGKEKGIELVRFDEEEDIDYVSNVVYKELEFGILKEQSKKHIEELIVKCHERKGIDCVIMGCTELPCLFTEEKLNDQIAYINTTIVHVESIIKKWKIEKDECL